MSEYKLEHSTCPHCKSIIHHRKYAGLTGKILDLMRVHAEGYNRKTLHYLTMQEFKLTSEQATQAINQLEAEGLIFKAGNLYRIT